MVGLVGDGLLEPFWPTGTGIASGFLGAFDAVWLVRQWAAGDLSPAEMLSERETILKLLPQTTAENITKDFKNVTIVPSSRSVQVFTCLTHSLSGSPLKISEL